MSTTQSPPPPPTTADLPKDIVVDILSRLPVRSLLRFKSVCKSWYALFTSPNFVTKHFTHTTTTETAAFIYTPRPTTTTTPTNIPNPNQSIALLSNNQALEIPINIDIPFLSVSKPLRVSGSSNGLICLTILPLASIILLWNPATRVFKNLPNSPIPRPQTLPIKVVIGFGLDPKTNDYKVLRIVYYCYPLKQIEIYSLRNNNWREVSSDMRFLIFESSCSVFVGGKFHWRAIRFGDLNGREVIVSFDMDDEVFRYIQLPNFGSDHNNGDDDDNDDDDDDDDDEKCSWRLVKFKEFLGVVVWVENGSNKRFDVWVMNEYGVAASWTKCMSFGPLPRISRLLGCGKNGEVLLESSDMLLYDPSTETIKNLGSHGVECWSDVFVHEESLLPINGGKVVGSAGLGSVNPDFFFVRKFDLMIDDN